MTINIIKLAVGVDDLAHLDELCRHYVLDYNGQLANMVRTRFQPKQADDILKSGGSLYRVIKGRILCRQKIIGFEKIETPDKGAQCAIMVERDIIQTIAQSHRPFQGWRYLKASDTPSDRGLYDPSKEEEDMPEEMADSLKDMGLL